MHERPRLPSDRAEPASSFPPAAGVAPRATPAREGGLGLNDPRALAILSTEHTSLLSNRSNLWNESFSRAALFLSVLSAGVIALSLIGTERPDFQVFALILLPVTLFIGLTTFVRIDDSNREELRWVVAMNRLRHAYVSMVPELGDRFVSGVTDDLDGLLLSYGLPSGTNYSIFHFFVTMPGMVAVVNGVSRG
jgi:hypothetical protein